MNQEILLSEKRPFRATPDTKFYFAYDSIETARQTVVRAMLRAEGPAIVLGGAGLGKSLLGEMIAADLCHRMDIVRLHAARLCSRRALLQSILFELQLPYRDMSEGELRLSILDRLEPSPEAAPDGVLLIVDEAHTLPAKLLDELRLINNFTRNCQPRTRLVLLGNMRLEDTLTEPQMESFSQRLAARCYLQPMNRESTYAFVRHQLTVADTIPSNIITTGGLDALYLASEGVPRLVNQVMDHAIVLAITNKQSPISAALIQEAWADLQQLPAPWHSSADASNHSQAATSVEFGTLDDLDEGSSVMEAYDATLSSTPDFEEEGMDDEAIEAENCLSPTVSSVTEDFRDEEPTAAIGNKNFFAAFSPIEGLDDIDQEVVSTQQNLGQAKSIELARPQVAFDASIAVARPNVETAASEREPTEAQTLKMSVNSYFTNKPTDDEMIAFEDEQAEYDAMGVWENDPPISRKTSLTIMIDGDAGMIDGDAGAFEAEADRELATDTVDCELATNAADCDRGANSTVQRSKTSPSELFGSDFDEELTLSNAHGAASISQQPESTPRPQPTPTAEVGAESTAELGNSQRTSEAILQENADYVARIQDFADSIAKANADAPTVDEVIGVGALSAQEMSYLGSWEVSTDALHMQSEIEVAQNIEDIVSQLNFSAFSVEPFSVEQISLNATKQSKSGKAVEPADSVRLGDNAEVYMLHRAQELESQSIFDKASLDFDDDRDMLVVEEDLPVSVKATDSVQKGSPTKTAPYTQLFAKLRK